MKRDLVFCTVVNHYKYETVTHYGVMTTIREFSLVRDQVLSVG